MSEPTNTHHKDILSLLIKYSLEDNHIHDSHGSSKPSYPITVPTSRKAVKEWLQQTSLTFQEYEALLDSLSRAESYDEFCVIGKLLDLCPKLRSQLAPEKLDFWLTNAEGWAEVDTLCQNTFKYQEMFASWKIWEKLIVGFSESENISKRRASLVLLVGPVRYSADPRLVILAFQNIEKLKVEKDILITKAISWILRDLTKFHRAEVEAYLTKNIDTLPKIAVRETLHKLKSGRKSGR